jgi:DNA-binding MarR family transcriptional regulator
MQRMNSSKAARTIAQQCLAMRVRRLSRVVTRKFDETLRPLGVTPAQLSLLVIIELHGSVSPSAVARYLDIEKSTLSRNLRLMKAAGWVRGRLDGSERRLELTAAGRRLLTDAYPLWERAQKKVRDLVGTKTVEALSSLGSQ